MKNRTGPGPREVSQSGTVIGTMESCIKFFVVDSRMSRRRGEGEEEIGNQEGSGAKSFSQETEAQGQRSKPRKGLRRPTLKRLKCRTHAVSLTQLPIFISSGRFEFIEPAIFFEVGNEGGRRV